ncbi:RsmB/NOP family class I SAM-dependent RNA methyltransferase [Chachezhania sediminis]|uniref:RsmB/NOP family class I SAM-dependent RNA methyltransferase n=1 Tax=Chachezhania sediminis TaxID=2599291 RepID=UPI00131EBC9F|nr:RsmB/NOP family class I SAM-dependent RNA methyltransferase [Chachezhania sediminis]
MTPAARAQTAIQILDEVLAGAAAEQALTAWARRSRYAGSGDRAAVRDLVFDALRCLRSCAAAGGRPAGGLGPETTGRALILGQLRLCGTDPDTIFTGERHAPEVLTAAERESGASSLDELPAAERRDLPDWVWPEVTRSARGAAEETAQALRHRAQVHLRVNRARADLQSAIGLLAADGITAVAHPAAPMALLVTGGARRIRNSAAYRDGVVELQDAASQAICATLPLKDGMRVLDYCAGGGGKTLAMAAEAKLDLFAHDAQPQRMRDLADRADRAGVVVTRLATGDLARQGPFDLVLCDVPCSGSGAWRRAPEGKWRLTPDRLAEIRRIQAAILASAAALVRPGGTLAYATCSIFRCENTEQISEFVERNSPWKAETERHWALSSGLSGTDTPETDGFYLSMIERS